jgi:hypothetical protein
MSLCILLAMCDLTQKSIDLLVTNKPKYFVKKNGFLWL